ncbi:SprT-like domain-containing protein [Vibrio coralliilyticus]|uniref:SprT-like domain-containing protein n=1 Tax=Vibrio coralliilyticus TaxID=190893 RepID=UPI001E28E999|nr:SprT-like domain-containing protein [Vibrio coralliilyticus]MCC2525028.1 SprT-like domain-containing protein [Vibrio coralliilyticus]
MLKNLSANKSGFQERAQTEATLMVQVAIKVASNYFSEFDFEHLFDPFGFEVELAWNGSSESEVVVCGSSIHMRLALHELFRYERGGQFYYSETTASARKKIPDSYMCYRGALCALIAHEVAHLALFVVDSDYGKRPHNKVWLELTLYLRAKLLPVFSFDAEELYREYVNGQDHLNFSWPLLKSYNDGFWKNAPLEHRTTKSFYLLVKEIIERLVSQHEVEGLYLLTDSLFVDT